jgi:hypothetical protein
MNRLVTLEVVSWQFYNLRELLFFNTDYAVDF